MKRMILILMIFISLASISCVCAESSVDNATICHTQTNVDNVNIENTQQHIAVNENTTVKVENLNDSTINNMQNESTIDSNVNITIPKIIVRGESAVFNLPADATGNLSVTIENKTGTAPIVNGTATLPDYDIPMGNYKANISYSGDAKYAPVNKIVDITIGEYKRTEIFIGHIFIIEHMTSHEINWIAEQWGSSVDEVKQVINDMENGKYGAPYQNAILKKLDYMKKEIPLLKSYIIDDFKSIESSEKLINQEHNPELAKEISQIYGRCTLENLTKTLGITSDEALLIIHDMKNGDYGIRMENSIKRANYYNNMDIEIFESYLY